MLGPALHGGERVKVGQASSSSHLAFFFCCFCFFLSSFLFSLSRKLWISLYVKKLIIETIIIAGRMKTQLLNPCSMGPSGPPPVRSTIFLIPLGGERLRPSEKNGKRASRDDLSADHTSPAPELACSESVRLLRR
uniref:Uncharacterized protein n=1 Tax=Rhipicephalus zambeziensis TaxID=60191 RepID=A0A224YL59_9ACAR